MNCNLCKTEAIFFYTGKIGQYFRCGQCKGIFLSPEHFLNAQAEKKRYEKHNNDIHDTQYQKFVSPIVEKVTETFTIQHQGLDFGCGAGSAIHHVLTQKGFTLDLYDPFFENNQAIFSKKYDFIACCEVMEHFNLPLKEFSTLYSLLNAKGKIFCMTDLYQDDTDFESWYYKNDPTHVFFYHPDTIRYIQENIGFKSYLIENRLIIFEK